VTPVVVRIPSALATARLLAAAIDNPALAPLLDGRA
jgi:hypothetical protein